MKNQFESGGSSREKIYNFLVKFITENGYSPSFREICEGTYLRSTSNINSHLFKLKQEGKINMKGSMPRTISLVGYKYVKVEDK